MLEMLPSRRQRLAVRALLVAVVATTAVYALTLVPGLRAGTGYDARLDGWLNNAAMTGAALLVVLRAALLRAERMAWSVMALGAVLYQAGNVSYYLDVRGSTDVQHPTYADVLWLCLTPLAYVSVVLLVRARVTRFHPSVWLDGAVVSLSAAALAVQVALGEVLAATSGSPEVVATHLAFPLVDLVLLTVIVTAFALLGWRPGGAWNGLLVGFLVLLVTDSVYLFQIAEETYDDGGPVDLGWSLALLALGVAAWMRTPPARSSRLDGFLVLALPALALAVAVGLLVHGVLAGLDRVALGLAVGAIVVGSGRVALTFREVRDLAASRLQARTDELTGLPNRRAFAERAGEELTAAAAASRRLAVIMIDLDRFKEINDSLGHHVGDELLVAVGARLQGCARSRDLLVRLGGDEFALLLPDAGVDTAVALAQRVREQLLEPFEVDGITLHLDASSGVAVFPDHASGVSALLQRADVAMYEAKRQRSGVEVYRPAIDVHSRERLELLEDLRRALSGDQLVLHYQPKVEVRGGRVAGLEALVRWQHPDRGLLLPDSFIPLAEQTGLMHRLTEIVLDKALQQCSAWLGDGLPGSVAVNLSPSNLLDAGLPQHVALLLARYGVPAEHLELEITESVLVLDPMRSGQVLARLRDMGVRLSIDDYGTGYSSLAYLRELPVHDLKIDRSFVLSLDEDPLAAAIVRSTVGLAHSLGLRLVAEGVENEATLQLLREYGCDLAQGYHLSPPMRADEASRWLARHSTSPRVTAPELVPEGREQGEPR